jgi:carbamoyltransferase
MNVLGISSFYHDSAACVVRSDGFVAAAQEERFDRVKGSAAFPIQAINACLQAAGLTPLDVDRVAFYEKPFLKFERAIVDHVAAFPFSWRSFRRTMPDWLADRLTLPLRLKRDLGLDKPVHFVKHHLAHAASAFLVSPFEEAAILTVDGVGEWATTTWGEGRGARIDLRKEIRYPDSLGLLYTTVTTYLGFEANRGEGKVMALASFGSPSYLAKLREVVRVADDGSFRMDPSYFRFRRGGVMWSPRFEREFGPPRQPRTELTERHHDIAASLQALLEDALFKAARHVAKETGLTDLCLAGGVALNCAANGKLRERTPFRRVFVQPGAGDGGTALGSACFVAHGLMGRPRVHVMRDAYLGPEYSDARVRRAIATAGLAPAPLPPDELLPRAASLIAAGRVVGWFEGRMEFGPRALGHRSILADPRHPGMKDLLNEKVKHREPFRPYGASVLLEDAGEWFESADPSPFMLFAVRARPGARDRIPSAIHVDGTCRHQTVTAEDNGRYRDLVAEFKRQTGVPMVINTSFNDNNEPIVCTPEDALACFRKTRMDALVLGDHLLEKPEEQG